MSASKTIATPKEVISLSPAREELLETVRPILDVLPHTERDFLEKLLGEENYEKLLEDVVARDNIDAFNPDVDYVLDNAVFYQGLYYKAKVAEVQYKNTPNCNDTEWTLLDKFETECYNEMWNDGGLGKIVAWVVFAEAVIFYPKQLQASGFSGHETTGGRVTHEDNYKQYANNYKNNLYVNIEKMVSMFLKWNKKNGCLDIAADSCGDGGNNIGGFTQNKVNRQTAWR